jgi:hypothetical protein
MRALEQSLHGGCYGTVGCTGSGMVGGRSTAKSRSMRGHGLVGGRSTAKSWSMMGHGLVGGASAEEYRQFMRDQKAQGVATYASRKLWRQMNPKPAKKGRQPGQNAGLAMYTAFVRDQMARGSSRADATEMWRELNPKKTPVRKQAGLSAAAMRRSLIRQAKADPLCGPFSKKDRKYLEQLLALRDADA